MTDTKENIGSLLKAGANFIHVDTTVGRTLEEGKKESLTPEEVARRSAELIAYSESVVSSSEGAIEPPVYEIGSDEPGSKELTSTVGLRKFLESLKVQLKNMGLESMWGRIMFVVGNTGTTMKLSVETDSEGNVVFDKFTGEPCYAPKQEGFSVKLAKELAAVAKDYGLYPTQHYSDWIPEKQGADISGSVVKVNVGPEFEVNGRLAAAFDLEQQVNKALSAQGRSQEEPGYYKSLVELMDKPDNTYIWKKWGPTPDEVAGLVAATVERTRAAAPQFTALEKMVRAFGEKEINIVASRIMTSDIEIFVPQHMFQGASITEIKEMLMKKFGKSIRLYRALDDLNGMINKENASRAIVLLSGDPADLKNRIKALTLTNDKLVNARFLNMEIPDVSRIKDPKELDSYYKRAFSTLYLARIAKASDVVKDKETPTGMMLRYYLFVQIGDEASVDSIIAGLTAEVIGIEGFLSNAAMIIDRILRYRPSKAVDPKEVDHVTEALWRA